MHADNLFLAKREGRTGENWPEVVRVRTDRERSEVCTETTESQSFLVRFHQANLVSSLLYTEHCPAFKANKYTAYDLFHGNGKQGRIFHLFAKEVKETY